MQFSPQISGRVIKPSNFSSTTDIELEVLYKKGVPKLDDQARRLLKRKILKKPGTVLEKERRPSIFKENEVIAEKQTELIEDAVKSNYQFGRLQIIEDAAYVFALLSILLSAFEYDMRYGNYKESYVNTMLILISCSTILLVILTILRYYIQYQLLQAQRLLRPDLDHKFKQRLLNFILELVVIIPHPNLLTKDIGIHSTDLLDQIIITYSVNDFLDIYILMRIYIIFRVFLNATEYISTRAARICRMYDCDYGYFYATKCLMSESPLTTVSVLMVVCVFIGGQAIRICEEPLAKINPSNSIDFSYYNNCFWCMIITMTGVGYGDYYARTIPGRVISILASFAGVFLVSLLTVALTNTLAMDTSESKSHILLNRLETRDEMNNNAANLIKKAAELSLKNMKKVLTLKQAREFAFKVRDLGAKFHRSRRDLRWMFEGLNFSHELATHFEELKNQIVTIYLSQTIVQDFLVKLKRKTTADFAISDQSKISGLSLRSVSRD